MSEADSIRRLGLTKDKRLLWEDSVRTGQKQLQLTHFLSYLLKPTLLYKLWPLLFGLDRQVFCIRKGDTPHNDCTCITHIGFGVEIIAREEAIRRIDAGVDTFWVEDPMDRSRTNVKVAALGSLRYLRTRDDDTDIDNLLQLREC